MTQPTNKPAGKGEEAVHFAADLKQLKRHLSGCYSVLKRWERALETRKQPR